MPRNYTKRTIKRLFGAAAGRCAYPGCDVNLVPPVEGAADRGVLADIAHIIAHEDDGPRGDPTVPAEERDRYENLILLCPTHHRLVDSQPDQHPPEMLRQWKADHESWVERELGRHIRQVSFTELASITRALADGVVDPSTDFEVLDPRSKMKRNALGRRTDKLLRMGLMRSSEVRAYLVHHAALDPDFPERLKARFVAEYQAAHGQGLRGDDLFAALVDFAQQGATRFELTAAGLAVVCYLFETCEVFER